MAGNATTMSWPCDDIGSIVCCYVPRTTRIKMIGDPLNNDTFFVVNLSFARNSLMLEGERSLQVRWENSSTVQVVTKKGQVLFSQNPNTNHFMGRSTWTATRGVNLNLTFSTCQTGQFSCSNGECVPLSRRCDGSPADCSDNSDDDDTCWNFLGPPNYYFPGHPPADPHINLTLLVTHVPNVDTDRNQLKASHLWLLGIYYEARETWTN